MGNLTISVKHRIKNRIRLKLSHSIKRKVVDEIIIQEHEGIESVDYNDITKSILVKFNNLKIHEEEVIIRVALVYSKNYGFAPVKLVSNLPKTEMPVLSYYSMLSIIAAAAGRFIKPLGNIQDFLNWLSVGTTIGAIAEHAYSEINETGTVDPEVMSVMYLINSIKKGNFVESAGITWIATFGRHILRTSYDKAVLNAAELIDSCTGEVYYNVSISPYKSSKDKIGFLKEFLSKFIEKERSDIEKAILVTKNGINNLEKQNCGFLKDCKSIKVNYQTKFV